MHVLCAGAVLTSKTFRKPDSKTVAGVAALLSVIAFCGAVTLKVANRTPESYYQAGPPVAPGFDYFPLPKPASQLSKLPDAVDPFDPKVIPVPADTSHMTVALMSSAVGAIPAVPAKAPASVGVMDAPSNTLVDPPTGPDKKGADWNDTTVRIKSSAYPSYPSLGTTYVYGHSCLSAICPFSAIRPLETGGYTVQKDDLVIVTTPTGQLTYEVTQVGSVPKKKTGSLPSWASDGSVPNRLVLVTCEYDENGNSSDNIVISADLLWTKRF